MVFDDGSRDVCYIDDWDIIHGEETRIIKGRVPVKWKKIEKDMGEYVWQEICDFRGYVFKGADAPCFLQGVGLFY